MTMSTTVFAKNPPAEVTAGLHELLEYALWFALMGCLFWLIVSGGLLAYVKFTAEPIWMPVARIVRSLIGAVMASGAMGTALSFVAVTQ